MPIKQESLNNQLEDELSKYNPVPVTSGGKEVDVADEADVFRFDFIKDGVNYGPVHVSIDGTQKLIIYYSKDVEASPKGKSIDGQGEESFEDLCRRLYRWAVGHQLRPQKVYSSKLGRDMAKREHTKRMDEGYYPISKKSSYSDNIAETKIIIQHSRALEEGEQRFRNIARIFVENASGERFLLDTKMPGLARVHARNIAEGHTPYDERGKHITSLIKEYNTMAGFCRATKHNANENISHLVESGFQHYGQMRETLRKLSSKRGYKEYFESWTPTLNEEVVEESTTDLAEMFLNSSIDPRIENALPFLSKFAKPVMEMNEVSELEEWTNSIVDEALRPHSKAQIEDLVTLLRTDNLIPFGPNALTVKSELSGLLDNDQLFSKLEQLSKKDPDADAKDSVLAWMELSRDPAMQEVVDMVKAGSQPAPAPAEPPPQPAAAAPAPSVPQQPLQEFAMDDGDDGNEPDEEAILRQLASHWWLGTEQQMAKAQKTLAAMGWEIGQDESGDDDAGVFLIRPGDVHGDSYIAFPHSELELDEGQTSDMRDFFSTQPGTALTPPIQARVTREEEDPFAEGQTSDMRDFFSTQPGTALTPPIVARVTREEEDPFADFKFSNQQDDAAHEKEVFARMRQDAKDGKATKVNTLNPIDQDQYRRNRQQDMKSIPVTKQNEGLDANQKRVGQLGPKAKYAKQGDLVGTMESVDPLDELKRLLGK